MSPPSLGLVGATVFGHDRCRLLAGEPKPEGEQHVAKTRAPGQRVYIPKDGTVVAIVTESTTDADDRGTGAIAFQTRDPAAHRPSTQGSSPSRPSPRPMQQSL